MKKLLLTLAIAVLPLVAAAQVDLVPAGSTGGANSAGSTGGVNGAGSAGGQSDAGSTGGLSPAGSTGGLNSAGSTGGFFPAGSTGVPGYDSSGNCTGTNCYAVKNPLKVTSICGFLKNLFQALLPIIIAVGVVFIVWSGFMFVLAQGKPKELGKAKQNFLYVIIGLSLVLGAWLIAEVIAATINALGGAAIISCS